VTSGQKNILLTGGGAPGAAGILRCLKLEPSFDVIVADADNNAVGKYLAKDFLTIPKADDPSFIDSIYTVCRQKNIHAILPLVTKELIPLSQHVEEFARVGTKILVSSFASLEIANNKSRLYEFLQWRGIAVPEFRIVETTEQFERAVIELGYPAKQVCFKPSVSNGSRGFRIITEKINELDLLFNYKPTSTYINFADALRILSSGSFPELLISEYLSGEEYSVDCLCNIGESVLVVPRLRKKMINGISVEGEFVNNQNIINYCRNIIKELQLHGNIGIQVKQSTAGEFLILEINPRVQGTISAGLGAGINLPVLALKQALDIPVTASELHVKWGVRFSRYWEEVFY